MRDEESDLDPNRLFTLFNYLGLSRIWAYTLGQPFRHNMLRLDTFEVSKVVSINAYTISIANHHT